MSLCYDGVDGFFSAIVAYVFFKISAPIAFELSC